jgi:hypothetical protein
LEQYARVSRFFTIRMVGTAAVVIALATSARAATPASFVGTAVCAECHADADATWRGSHHALAMQVADDATVLGNFEGAKLTNFGVTSTFTKKDGKYWIRTAGPDGKLADYEVLYTFGVAPLQQYLVAFPDGRFQAPPLAWDTRPKSEGGQRWFSLQPDEAIPPGDLLHWTGVAGNWNQMCASCHSTDLRKHYDTKADRFATSWSEISVGCEACHGPGSKHVAWAKAATSDPPPMNLDATPEGSARFPRSEPQASGETHKARLLVDLPRRDPFNKEPTHERAYHFASRYRDCPRLRRHLGACGGRNAHTHGRPDHRRRDHHRLDQDQAAGR